MKKRFFAMLVFAFSAAVITTSCNTSAQTSANNEPKPADTTVTVTSVDSVGTPIDAGQNAAVPESDEIVLKWLYCYDPNFIKDPEPRMTISVDGVHNFPYYQKRTAAIFDTVQFECSTGVLWSYDESDTGALLTRNVWVKVESENEDSTTYQILSRKVDIGTVKDQVASYYIPFRVRRDYQGLVPIRLTVYSGDVMLSTRRFAAIFDPNFQESDAWQAGIYIPAGKTVERAIQ